MSETGIVIVVVAVALAGLAGALLVGLLRRRSGSDARAPAGTGKEVAVAERTTSTVETRSSGLAALDASAAALPPEAIRFVLGDLEVGEIRSFSGDLNAWKSVDDHRIGHAIEAIVRGAPLAALGVQAANGGLYVVKLAGEAAGKVADGTWKFMQAAEGGVRSALVDAAGAKIRGGAAFVQVSAAAGAGVAVWQILAVITSQKFLADIDKKLADIEAGIGDLQATLEENRRGRLIGNLKYLRQLAEALSGHVVSEEEARLFLGQLEDIEREGQQLEAASAQTMDRYAAELERLPLKRRWRLKDKAKNVHHTVNEFAVAARTRLLALKVRGVACQLRAALPIRGETTLIRARDVGQSLMEAKRSQRAYLDNVHDRSGDLRGYLTFDSTDKAEQARLRRCHHELKAELDRTTEPLAESIQCVESAVSRRLEGPSEPVELLVSVDGAGRVERVRQR